MKRLTLFLLLVLVSSLTVCHAQLSTPEKAYLKTFSRDGTVLKIVEPNLADSTVSYRETVELYQFNVTLEKSPASNVLTFQLETSGLTFYYQPPLNKELNSKDYAFLNETHALNEKGQVLNYRPENVVGSYAVYKTNPELGETGKLYHIYRPLIIDVKGVETWGTLNVTKSSLTVTIPQSFIDKAVYPVTVDPSFGYSTVGASKYNDWNGNCLTATKFSAGEDGELTGFSGYIEGVNVPKTFISGLYSDNVGAPDAKLVECDSQITISDTTPRWYNWTASYSFTASAYWIANTPNAGGNYYIYYDSGDVSQSCHKDATSSLADPFGSPSSYLNYKFSYYANYTASTPAGPETVSAVLDSPANESTATTYTVDFVYTPTLLGSDTYHNASLYLNGTLAASNSTAILNVTTNTITTILAGTNATYLWDVQVWNSTTAVFSSNGNFTLFVEVSESAAVDEDELLALGLVAVIVGCTVTGVCVYGFRKQK